MSTSNDGFVLNESEIWFTNIILVGTTKLISNLIHKNPKDMAKSYSYNFIKPLVHTAAISSVQKLDDNEIFRRIQLFRKLPEWAQKIEDGDSTRILKSMTLIGLIRKISDKNMQKKWGRPSKDNPYVSDIPGPKVFFELADFYKNIRKALSNPHVVRIIYSVLYHSRMINRLVQRIEMICYYVIKLNNRKEIAWEILKSFYPIDIEEKKFYEDYDIIRSIKNQKELKKLAKSRATAYVNKRNADDYILIFESGGLFYGI